MGMTVPGEVQTILSIIGFTWPKGDETKLLDLGQSWSELSGLLDGHVNNAQNTATQVWNANKGEMISAFQARWTGDGSPVQRLNQGGTGADIVGVGMMVCAGIVLALKINVIVQATLTLIAIASAIAAAFVTFGASTAVIALLREALKRLLNWLLDQAVGKVLGG
ncbi:MAG: hypothetical protein HOV71_26890 [Hamadaea sp.]|uniref:WXG100-like domain-containing protein n=1 Tax=Hamadaea sp. NPDC050747 TaxID=3155789 RepID=UPI00179227FA|nr:hypothetical protein [Hamadaea sp.]NUR51768.1 hypothetical protein [Hamadaea sp.]NUT03136.1 hypothetical protein [Hamadaea sp.]